MNIRLQHEEPNSRFVADLGLDGEQPVLNYRVVDDGTLDFASTLVPPSLRGQGLGTELVLGALRWARDHDYRVIPSCTFVAEVLERFPEHQEVLA